MPKNKKPPTFHEVPAAFTQAATAYLSSAILGSDRPIGKVFAAVKRGKEVARGLITKSIDEIQVLEEKRKFKLMLSGELDPAPDPMALELIALLKLAVAGESAAAPGLEPAAIETPAAAEIVPVPTVATPEPKDAIATVSTTLLIVVESKRVIPSPTPKPSAPAKRIISIVPAAIVNAPETPLVFPENSTFKQFFKLKVANGGDRYSLMTRPRLVAELGDRAGDVQQEIEQLWQACNDADGEGKDPPYSKMVLGRVLRWYLRGLSLKAAIRKVRTDYEGGRCYAAKANAIAIDSAILILLPLYYVPSFAILDSTLRILENGHFSFCN